MNLLLSKHLQLLNVSYPVGRVLIECMNTQLQESLQWQEYLLICLIYLKSLTKRGLEKI